MGLRRFQQPLNGGDQLHVQLLQILHDGLHQLHDDGVAGGDVGSGSVVKILGLRDGKDAEVPVHAFEADVLAVFDGRVHGDGSGEAVCPLIVHQLRDAARGQDLPHPLGSIEDVDHHRYSSFHVAVMPDAWAHWMLLLPGVSSWQNVSRSVTA